MSGARAIRRQHQNDGVTGDPFAEEPWCGYRPGSFPHRRELATLLADGAATAGAVDAPVHRAEQQETV